MAQQLKRLTQRSIDAIKNPGRYADGGGLYLVVTLSKSTGAPLKQWAFMWRRNGKRREMGLGAVHTVSLAKARKRADECRAMAADGLDPIEERKKARTLAGSVPTFGKCADDFLNKMRPEFRNKKHAAQWEMTLGVYCSPIRDIPVDQIETANVLDVLSPHWQRAPETASRLRGRIERVLDAAKAKGYRSGENPARWRGHLDLLLPKTSKLRTVVHHPALDYKHIPWFMQVLRERHEISARLLEFTMLTAARPSEARKAIWEEFELDARLWAVPAHRMKGERVHRVPLTEAATRILEVMARHWDGKDGKALVFPGARRGRPLSENTCNTLLRRMGKDKDGDVTLPWSSVTTHGFRSSFRDWCEEITSFPPWIAEAALAHVVGDETERAYRRGDVLEKRRKLMEAWAEYCEQTETVNVVRLGGHSR